MALIKGPPKLLATVAVNGTDHFDYYRKSADRIYLGDELELVRVHDNPHDVNAIAVCRGIHLSSQIGWVPMKRTAELAPLIAGKKAWLKVRHHQSWENHFDRLKCDLYVEEQPEAPPLPLPDEVVVMNLQKSGQGDGRESAKAFESMVATAPGRVFIMETAASRVSVSITSPATGNTLAWFRKSELPNVVLTHLDQYQAVRQAHDKDGLIRLVRKQQSNAKQVIANALQEAREASIAAGHIKAGDFTKIQTHAGDAQNYLVSGIIATQPQPPKEPTMNTSTISAAVSSTFAANKSAAAQAGYMEAGRIANNSVSKLASKHLPLMLRGYADTALGKLVIANIAALAAQQLRPQDKTLAALTNAMTVQAFQEIYQSVDIEGMINGLLSSPEMQTALAKMPQPEAPVPSMPADSRTVFGSGYGVPGTTGI